MTGPDSTARTPCRGPCEAATRGGRSGGAGALAAGDRRERHTPWAFAGEAQLAVAASRLAAVRRSDALHAGGLPRADADALVAAEAGASTTSVRRWRACVRDLAPGNRLGALIDRKPTGRPPKIEGELREALEALATHFGDHLTAPHAHRTLLARYGRAPAVSTIRHWIARYRAENARELSAVADPDRHRSHRKPAGGDAAAGIVRLNQVWELDSTLADVICADGKRHSIVSAIDIWSRRARILVVPTSRATAIAALLRRCILEWGVPEIVRTDQGKDYTSRHVVSVLENLEIEHRPCPPFRPELKPFVERFLGTLARDLFAFLPGFTGHDVAQAQALRARKSFAQRQAGQTPRLIGTVNLTAEELQAACDDWCETVYEQRGHGGLEGVSPFVRFHSWPEPKREVYDERALDALLAEPAGDGWRTVGKKGIRLDRLDYIAAPLGRLVRQRVRILHDPADAGRIHVYRPHPAGEGFVFVCVAVCPALTGDDRAAIAGQMTADWNGANREARKWARDLAKRYRPETAMNDVLDHAKRKAGRVVALPGKGRAHETPALAEAAKAAKAAGRADAAKKAPPARKQSLAAIAGRLYLEET